MRIKIQGGTAHEGDAPLCQTCRRATVVRGPRLRDEIVQCQTLETRITFPVVFCTSYVNRQHASVHDMEDIAWVLRTDPTRRQIGFQQPKGSPWIGHLVDDE